jgi:hypothetical protein
MYSAIQLFRSSLLNSNGCGLVSVIENSLQSDFSIYPTFASETIHLVSNKTNEYQLEVFTISGKMIKRETIKGSSNQELNVLDLESGIYFLKITSKESSFTEKFVKVGY